MNKIKTPGKEYLLHENLSWGRVLDFYLQENSYLKTRLSQLLDRQTTTVNLLLSEKFNNSFIENDAIIKEMRMDVQEQALQLRKIIGPLPIDDKKLLMKQKKLHNEVDLFEKKFMTLKKEFNNFIISTG